MGQNRRILGSVWAFGYGAWRSLRNALAGAPKGAGGPPQDVEGHAETKRRLRAELRESGFRPPAPEVQRQRAAARLCALIEERGKDNVERVLMKVSRG